MAAIWIAGSLAALIWLITLRISVRLMGKELDNGWDNALGYGIVTALIISGLLSLLGTGWLALMTPVLLWLTQTGALSFIYEIKAGRAVLLGVLHTALFSAAAGATAIVAGAIAIYLLYGKIVADPLVILRVLLRWLGIDWPF